MFARIFVNALLAGCAAGLVAAVIQLVFVQPLLIEAELYESGALSHFAEAANQAEDSDAPELARARFDPVRDGLSVIFSVLVYSGYALLLLAAMALASERGTALDGRVGLIWGAAGFVAVQLAPAFGLPPELPGSAAPDITLRQIWWFATIAATAVALWLAAFGKGPAAWGSAALLALAPHLVGAPAADAYTGPVPPELSSHFAARALGTGLAAWLVLGGISGALWQRAGLRQSQPLAH